jgi:Bacterial antitoxin of type II TA system, VapB
MRTTLNLDDHLLAEAKRLAAARGSTLTAVMEDALRIVVRRAEDTPEREPVELPSFGEAGAGFMPGVEIDDTAALLELMEGDAPLDARR